MKKTAAVLPAVVAAGVLALAGPAGAGLTYDRVAAPNGSDAAAGTVSAPFATAQKLVDSLQPGQTGCLRAGTYAEDLTIRNGGGAGAPVTLASYPGERATVTGRMWIAQGANYVTVTGLNLDGVNSSDLPSPSVNANNATFSYDDVTNDHTAICFVIGSSWGSADSTLITHNRIHDCGILPPQNHDHGIYVEDATNTTIEWNLIYANADRGIQLYPNAQYTTVDHNVIDGNGMAFDFSGDGGLASNNANVYDNLLTDSNVRYDVASWYPAGNPVGVNNELHDNCIYGGKMGTIDASGGGFSAYSNQFTNPQYVNAAGRDYHLASTSPCLPLTGDIAAAVDGTSPTQPVGGGTPSGGTTTTPVGTTPTPPKSGTPHRRRKVRAHAARTNAAAKRARARAAAKAKAKAKRRRNKKHAHKAGRTSKRA